MTGFAVAAAMMQPAPAAALDTIVQDDALMLHSSAPQIRTALQRARGLGMTRVRLTAGWSVIAPGADASERPRFDATDPAAYPAGRWDNLDRAVRLTHEAGLSPMIDIAFWAPRWAAQDPAGPADRLAEGIDTAEFAGFAQAVATRYSGTYSPPGPQGPDEDPADGSWLDELLGNRADRDAAAESEATEPLPAVDLFTIWNEPNHPAFLRPQWVRGADGAWRVHSAELYREMVYRAYPVIKRAAPGARVLVGGTAPLGSSTPGRSGVPPLRFLREMACVDAHLDPVTTGSCARFAPIPGDGWAHHPYSLRTTPDVDTRDRDKAPVAATPRVVATLRALVERGRLGPGLAELWLTEYGYETNAPDPRAPFGLAEQARLLAWAERIATREPAVRSWPQFQLYDRPSTPPRPGMREFGDWQSGLFFVDGSPKPAAAEYGTPVVAECAPRAHRWVMIWGRLRSPSPADQLEVQARDRSGQWTAVPSFRRAGAPVARARMSTSVAPGAPATRFFRRSESGTYRLRWTGGGDVRTSAALQPRCAG